MAAGERRDGEFVLRGGIRAVLLPKPVIGRGAVGVVASSGGWFLTASNRAERLPSYQRIPAFRLVSGFVWTTFTQESSTNSAQLR